jgi:hypothetical protein
MHRWHDLIPKRPKTLIQTFLDTINTFSKVSGYKINLQKSVASLYADHEQTKKKYRKSIPFTTASRKKYLGISLKNVNDLYKVKYKTLKKEIKAIEDEKISHVHRLVESA